MPFLGLFPLPLLGWLLEVANHALDHVRRSIELEFRQRQRLGARVPRLALGDQTATDGYVPELLLEDRQEGVPDRTGTFIGGHCQAPRSCLP